MSNYRYFRAKEPATHDVVWRVNPRGLVESRVGCCKWVHYNTGATLANLEQDPLVEEFQPIDWTVVGPKCAEALKKITGMIEVRGDPKHVVPFIPYAFYSDFLDELAKAQEALALAEGGEG